MVQRHKSAKVHRHKCTNVQRNKVMVWHFLMMWYCASQWNSLVLYSGTVLKQYCINNGMIQAKDSLKASKGLKKKVYVLTAR